MRFSKYPVAVAFAVLAACGPKGPALDTLEAEPLFQRGIEALRAEEWSRAVESFERFALVFASHPRAAEARYRLGEAFMGREEYVTAALEFNRLANDFPAGPWADDSRYMVCMSYYELSPPSDLDQQYTGSAIDHCQSLITYYPDSEYVPRARERIEELTNRLAEKEYNTGDYYFRKQLYDSAIIYFQSALEDYPQTQWAPRALLRMHEAYVILKYDEEAQAARDLLLKQYPDSPEARRLGGAAVAPGGT